MRQLLRRVGGYEERGAAGGSGERRERRRRRDEEGGRSRDGWIEVLEEDGLEELEDLIESFGDVLWL